MWILLEEPLQTGHLAGGRTLRHACDGCGSEEPHHEGAVTSAVAAKLLREVGEIKRLMICDACGAQHAVDADDLVETASAALVRRRSEPSLVGGGAEPGGDGSPPPGGRGLFARLGRLFKSKGDAALDQLEDPRKTIEQLVLDMDAEIRRTRQETVRTKAIGKQAANRAAALEQEVTLWNGRAEQAVLAGDDELAKRAIEHRIELEEKRAGCRQEQAELEAAAAGLAQSLRLMEQKLASARLQKGTLTAKIGGQRTRAVQAGALDEFARMAGKIDDHETALEAEAELAQEGAIEERDAEVERRFAALDRSTQAKATATPEITDRLAALKRKMQEK